MSAFKPERDPYAPCPCNSGKKYKFCCLTDPQQSKMNPGLVFDNDHDDSFEAPNLRIRYGDCDLSNSEIDSENLHDLSAPRMIYSLLFAPEIEDYAGILMNRLMTRGREEAKQVDKANTIDQLIALMQKTPDPLNHSRLISKMVDLCPRSAERIFQEYEKPVSTTFLELGIRIIHRCGYKDNSKLLNLIENGLQKAYRISLLCMLLGFTGTTEHLAILWGYYKYFKEHFPSETYSDGPLLGMIEIRARTIEKNQQASKNA
jgi:hypothetical protein